MIKKKITILFLIISSGIVFSIPRYEPGSCFIFHTKAVGSRDVIHTLMIDGETVYSAASKAKDIVLEVAPESYPRGVYHEEQHAESVGVCPYVYVWDDHGEPIDGWQWQYFDAYVINHNTNDIVQVILKGQVHSDVGDHVNFQHYIPFLKNRLAHDYPGWFDTPFVQIEILQISRRITGPLTPEEARIRHIQRIERERQREEAAARSAEEEAARLAEEQRAAEAAERAAREAARQEEEERRAREQAEQAEAERLAAEEERQARETINERVAREGWNPDYQCIGEPVYLDDLEVTPTWGGFHFSWRRHYSEVGDFFIEGIENVDENPRRFSRRLPMTDGLYEFEFEEHNMKYVNGSFDLVIYGRDADYNGFVRRVENVMNGEFIDPVNECSIIPHREYLELSWEKRDRVKLYVVTIKGRKKSTGKTETWNYSFSYTDTDVTIWDLVPGSRYEISIKPIGYIYTPESVKKFYTTTRDKIDYTVKLNYYPVKGSVPRPDYTIVQLRDENAAAEDIEKLAVNTYLKDNGIGKYYKIEIISIMKGAIRNHSLMANETEWRGTARIYRPDSLKPLVKQYSVKASNKTEAVALIKRAAAKDFKKYKISRIDVTTVSQKPAQADDSNQRAASKNKVSKIVPKTAKGLTASTASKTKWSVFLRIYRKGFSKPVSKTYQVTAASEKDARVAASAMAKKQYKNYNITKITVVSAKKAAYRK